MSEALTDKLEQIDLEIDGIQLKYDEIKDEMDSISSNSLEWVKLCKDYIYLVEKEHSLEDMYNDIKKHTKGGTR